MAEIIAGKEHATHSQEADWLFIAAQENGSYLINFQSTFVFFLPLFLHLLVLKLDIFTQQSVSRAHAL